MCLNTGISNAMEIAEKKTTLDRHVVNLFSHKAVLAVLMMYCVEEFQGFSADYILNNCFVGEPVVREMPVDRDVPPEPDAKELPFDDLGGLMENETVSLREGSLLDGNERITAGESTDKTQLEGTVIYDIIFLAKAPKSNELIRLMINVEIQNDQNLRYSVATRGIYYCSRMISAQKNRTFKGSDYQKIQKVYSIWICPYARNDRNTVTTYDIRQNKVFGETDTKKEDYDKLETIVITMNEEGLQSENDLIRYLSLLLNKEMPAEQRRKRLESDYHLQMTEELRKDVGGMCNYSDAMLMLGRKEGREQGRAEGEFATLVSLVRKNLLSIKDAAEQAGMTEMEFCKKAGLSIQQ